MAITLRQERFRGPLTEYLIQNALYHALMQKQHRLICPNVYLFDWESDFLSVTKTGFMHEYEIKISRSDFKNDAKKIDKHEKLTTGQIDVYKTRRNWNPDFKEVKMMPRLRPNCFWYVCPENMIALDELPDHAGLMYVTQPNQYGNSYVTEVKRATKLHKEPITVTQTHKLANAFYWRYWRYRNQMDAKDVEAMEHEKQPQEQEQPKLPEFEEDY